MKNTPSHSFAAINFQQLFFPLAAKALTFSYSIHHFLSPEDIKIHLNQEISSFSLMLNVSEKNQQLCIESFKVKENPKLEDLSIALYDAAILELVIRGLECIFLIAREKSLQKCSFTLSKMDAHHLIAFEGLLKILPSPQDKKDLVYLEVCLDEQNYPESLERFQSIRLQIAQELWQDQREDKILRQFLQQPSFHLNNLLTPHETQAQILSFPQLGRK